MIWGVGLHDLDVGNPLQAGLGKSPAFAYRPCLVAGDTCDPTKGIDHLPTVKRCPGLFSGAAAEVSSSGWSVLFVLLVLLGVLILITLKTRSERIGGQLALLSVLALIPSLLMSLPSVFSGGVESWKANRQPGYGRVPDSAQDEELDLGDEEEELDEQEAEELDNFLASRNR